MHRLRAPVGVSEVFDLDGGSGRIHDGQSSFVVFMGAPFVVEHIQSFVDQFQEFIAGHLQMVRLHNGLVDVLDQQLAPGVLAQSRMIFFQEAAPPRQRLNHAQAFELRIGLGDGVAIDAQLLRQRTDGGKRLARLERPGSGGGFDLIHNLEVDGHAGLEIDLENHIRLSVIGQYDS